MFHLQITLGLIFSFSQVLMLISGVLPDFIYPEEIRVSTISASGIVTIAFFWLLRTYLSKIDILSFGRIRRSGHHVAFYAMIYTLACLYDLLHLSKYQRIGTLNSLQGEEGLGIALKLNAVMLPSLMALLIIICNKNRIMQVVALFSGVCISALSSTIFLTKAPIVSYSLVVLFLFIRGILGKYIVLALAAVCLAGVCLVYSIRAGDAAPDLATIIISIIYRYALVPELLCIIKYVGDNGPLHLTTLSSHLENITLYIFNRDPGSIGIAPSYIGFFYSIFGPCGVLISAVTVLVLALIIKALLSKGPFENARAFLYFLWFFELIPFLTDGNPSFYTGTTDNIMFWILVSSTVLLLSATYLCKILFQMMHAAGR